MKKSLIVLIVGITAIGAVSAQGFARGPGMAQSPQSQVQPVASTIEGKLALVQGHPALIVKDKTYYVRMPQTLYGFIDGLKEGATVKLEGFEMAIPLATNTYFFQVSTLTIGAKSYDLSQMAGAGFMGGSQMRGGQMGAEQMGRGNPRGGRGRW